MTIKAEIVKDSLSTKGPRLTTFLLTYPRFIHSEFMTHRAFSRNASSSRAIPFEKQVEAIKLDMAMPIEFRKNQKGMQAGEALDECAQEGARIQWKKAGLDAIFAAESLANLGIHKQYVNRLLEPFAHITVVCTATEYANFFALRHHHMAQPEIAELAKQMWELYSTNKPIFRCPGDLHLPFVSEEELAAAMAQKSPVFYQALIRKSVACCARTSYLNHDKTTSTQAQDDALYDRLVGSQPIHASPAEHQADVQFTPHWSGNFFGFNQHRKSIPHECILEFNGPEKSV